MIIVRLSGGLGNQLFQYATGYRLATKHGTCLALDLSALRRDQKRKYALSAFALGARMATEAETRYFDGRERTRAAKHALHQMLPRRLRKWDWVRQKGLSFDPRVLDLGDDVYLDGTWQSEGYFREEAEGLRRRLARSTPLTPATSALAEQMARCECPVSVHVRRGDFVLEERTARIHDVCGAAYYRRAAKLMREHLPAMQAFVFSDDPPWVRKEMRLEVPMTVVETEPSVGADEHLELMRRCHHHVIANSSFGWWGAWLASRPGQIVLAPSQWYKERVFDVREILPASWRVLSPDGPSGNE